MSVERNRVVQMLRTLALVHERSISRSGHPDEHRGAMQALRVAADAIERGAHDHPMFDEAATLRDIDLGALLRNAEGEPS